MNIKKSVLSVLFILMFLLSGCNGSGKPPASSVKTTDKTTEETMPSTEPELMYRPASVSKNAVTELKCSDQQYFISVKPLSGSKILTVSEIYDDENSKTVMQVIDTDTDEAVVKKEFEGCIVSDNISVTDKGIAVYIDAEKSFVFFDEELEEKEKFKFESGGVFSQDGKKYYMTMSNAVFETDVESGNIELVKVSDGLSLNNMTGLSVGDKYAVIQGDMLEDGDVSFPQAVVDVTNGNLKLLADNINVPLCGKNNLFITRTDEQYDPQNYYFINKNGCYEYVPESSEGYCTIIDNSDMICFHSNSDHLSPDTEIFTIYSFLKDGSVKTASVDSQKKETGMICRLNNGNIAFVSYGRDKSSLNVIDMSKVRFNGTVISKKVNSVLTVDREIEKQYAEQTKDDMSFTSINQLKAYTDILEDKYNVNFFISDECGDHDAYKEFNPTSDEYGQLAEIEMISSALKQLETSFEKYPDNFFEQFTDYDGNNGINIYLVGHIKDEFSAAYAFYDYDYGYYNMIFDISYDLMYNFPHEMWHSTENYINNYDYDILNDYGWYSLNPEDFEYSWEYEGYSEADSSYIYYDGAEDWYFIDEYSKVDPMEDKARIMEFAMSSEENSFFDSEHIVDKLDFMCDAVRDTFDTDGWKDVYWERYSNAS